MRQVQQLRHIAASITAVGLQQSHAALTRPRLLSVLESIRRDPEAMGQLVAIGVTVNPNGIVKVPLVDTDHDGSRVRARLNVLLSDADHVAIFHRLPKVIADELGTPAIQHPHSHPYPPWARVLTGGYLMPEFQFVRLSEATTSPDAVRLLAFRTASQNTPSQTRYYFERLPDVALRITGVT